MSTAAITFDQIERRADRTLAVAYWVKHYRNLLLCSVAMAALNFTLRGLMASLSADKLEALSAEQSVDLTKKLQALHQNLLSVLHTCGCKNLKANRLLRSSICGLEEGTEDLRDVIENLVLAANPKFRTLLSDCVQALTPVNEVGLVGRM